MNNVYYEKAKAECWKEFCKEHPLDATANGGVAFRYAFDRAYALGKQEKDAEGEEILIVSRKEIQQLVEANDIVILKAAGIDNIETIQAKTVNTILNRLFGSKCLPDEACNIASSDVASSELKPCEELLDKMNDIADEIIDKIEPKPAEPKFKLGDELVWDKRIIVKVDEIYADGEYLVYSRIGNRYIVKESDLEPYTEPEDESHKTSQKWPRIRTI